MIFKDTEWVFNALIEQFETETNLQVASVSNKYSHILGEAFEDLEYYKSLFIVEFKGIEFEIEGQEEFLKE